MARLTIQEGKCRMHLEGEEFGTRQNATKLHGTVRAPNGGTDFLRETTDLGGYRIVHFDQVPKLKINPLHARNDTGLKDVEGMVLTIHRYASLQQDRLYRILQLSASSQASLLEMKADLHFEPHMDISRRWVGQCRRMRKRANDVRVSTTLGKSKRGGKINCTVRV